MSVPTSAPKAPPRTSALQQFVPAVGVFRTYQRGWLPKDLVAGLVLSALLVPQGMAYAELAGLPPVTGLYTSILCLLGYAIFGPSRILVLGPDSSLGPMIAATIAPLALAGGDPAKAVALASVLALLVGVVMTVAGIAHLGFVADLLSKPTQIGYMNGLALTIVVGQLPKLFGFSVDADGLIAETQAFFTGLSDQLFNGTAALLAPGTAGAVTLGRSRTRRSSNANGRQPKRPRPSVRGGRPDQGLTPRSRPSSEGLALRARGVNAIRRADTSD